MLDTGARVGAKTLLAPASTAKDCDPNRIAEDLLWLSEAAAQRKMRIAYEAMAWSRFNNTLPAAWNLVRELDRPNVGVVVDSYHTFVRGLTVANMDGIPADRIFLVQFSDLAEFVPPSDYKEVARHERLLPGSGKLPLMDLVTALKLRGYEGPVGLEVFNDQLQSQQPGIVARHAFEALRSLWSAA
jgi:4-hydroxyphenylpyruvate dioxygenase